LIDTISFGWRVSLLKYVLTLLCTGGAADIGLSIIPVIEAAGGKVMVKANVTGQQGERGYGQGQFDRLA